MFVTSQQFRLSDTIGFDPGPVYVGFVVDRVALGQVFPCQFHSTGAPLLVKLKKKNDHLSLRLHNKGCTRSFKAAMRP
jgi:hypothetical protein